MNGYLYNYGSNDTSGATETNAEDWGNNYATANYYLPGAYYFPPVSQDQPYRHRRRDLKMVQARIPSPDALFSRRAAYRPPLIKRVTVRALRICVVRHKTRQVKL